MPALLDYDTETENVAMEGAVQEKFEEKFLHIALETRCPTFTTQLPKERIKRYSLELTTQVGSTTISHDAEEMLNKGVDLLAGSPGARKLINRAYADVESFVRDPALTQPSKIKGLLTLPMSRRNQFFQSWPAVKDQFYRDLEKFFNVYETEVRQTATNRLLPVLGKDLWANIQSRQLPPLDKVRRKFAVEVVTGHFRYEDLKDAESALAHLAASVRKDLAETLAELATRLSTNKKLSPNTFNELRSKLAMAKAFSDVVDEKLLDQIHAMEQKLEKIDIAIADNDLMGSLSMTQIIKGHTESLTKSIGALSRAAKDTGGVDKVISKFGVSPRLLGV